MGALIIAFAVSFILIAIGFVMNRIDDWDLDGGIWYLFGVIVLIITLFFSIGAWHDTAYKDVNTEILRQEYDALIVQLDNNFYNKFTYDGREKLMNEVVRYNKKITSGRAKHNSKWIGVFYQEDYNSLPLINLDRIKGARQ